MKEYSVTGFPPTDADLNDMASKGWEIHTVIQAGPPPQASFTRILWERDKPELA